MVDLPQIGTPMFVAHSEGVTYRSRLEAADGTTLRLAAPLETSGSVPRPGHKLDVYWAQPRCRVVLLCRVVEIAETAPFQWVLEAVGNPVASNRRRYVRGGGGGPVRLAAEEGDEAVSGRLLDISEGGLRCWVARAPRVGTGDPLQASVPLGRTQVELTGAVHAVRDAYDEPGQHVILRFEAGEREAQLIRQHVFATEIAERRRFEGRG